MRAKSSRGNPCRSVKPLRLRGLVQASHTDSSWTITLTGVRTDCANVRSPWNGALALVCGPGGVPVMVPFLSRVPREKVWMH